jgi:MoaA/NifB/PqqE/SkfB family radical SAM enzyme
MRLYDIDLSYWQNTNYEQAQQQLEQQLQSLYKEEYQQDEQIVLHHTCDFYVKDSRLGLVLRNIQTIVNETNISNAFVVIESTNPAIGDELKLLQQISTDPVPITAKIVDGTFKANTLDLHPTSRKENYQYGSVNPLKISLENVSKRERYLLSESKTFCMYPWIHLHAFPTGDAMPCCMTEHHAGNIGNCHTQTLKEIWNSPAQKQLRLDMLNGNKNAMCGRCYEQEESGFFSGRQSANKHHGHLIERVLETNTDGSVERFEMAYWDIRFSNLCNLKCRSCGHMFSSQWYKDQAKLAGPEWKETHKPMMYAGKHETDMLEQLLEHIDYVEQIYFAGGEPLVMEEHYIILDELIKRGKTDVRLIYNTNFTQVKLKDKHAFEQWKHFPNVAVGASLDAMGRHAEYIRSGTKWATVEKNRMDMIRECPHVDFYISCTLSIMNALHVTDFHRDWVEKGLITPQDFNVNILLDPKHYRIDVATAAYKEQVRKQFERHLEWLEPLDRLNRATQGYRSAINMLGNDNSALLDTFWSKTKQLDAIRNENVLDYIPELEGLCPDEST